MAAIDELKAFDIAEANLSLWVFKGPRGASNESPTYTAHWVETTEEVDAVLRQTVDSERQHLEETFPYDLLAQVNEASALTIPVEETYSDRITAVASAESENRRADNIRKIQNSSFYVVKFMNDDEALYAVRRTSSSWKTRRTRAIRSLILNDSTLSLDDSPRFDIENSFDFFIVAGEVVILHKGNFESILRYKAAHQEDFLELQQDPDFTGLFVDIAPLVEHVGSNKIQLRRMCAVRQKANYRDDEFMTRVRASYSDYGLHFAFTDDNKIIVTPETGAEIITVLLDHRLTSAFSKLVFDVPSAVPVSTTT